MTKNRINWIDFGKGFAIFLVVIGHVFTGLFDSGKFTSDAKWLSIVIAFIYIFHIPVFFALSGYFFKSVENFKEYYYYMKKKTIVLGLPYIFYSIIHYVLQKIAGGAVRVPTTLFNLINIYKEPLGVVWYLYTLWALYLVYGFLSIFIKNKNHLFMISILGYTITLVYMSEIFFVKKVLAWGVIFMLGSVLKTVKFNDIRFRNLILLGTIFNIVYIYTMYISFNIDGKIITDYNYPRWWISGYIGNVILAFIIFPKIEEISSNIFKYFSEYGKISIGILIFHSPISSMIRIVLLKMGIFNICIHVILGVILSWYLAILLTTLFRKIKYLDIIFIPQKYIKF